MPPLKQEVLTFKADEALSKALRALPNKSDFIRKAILQALGNMCPVCHGMGVLSIDQKKHFEEFIQTHPVQECGDCKGYILTCAQSPAPSKACKTRAKKANAKG